MDLALILGASIVLQLAAVVLALRLIRVTGGWQAWTLIAAALSLMTIRRCITFWRLVTGDLRYKPDMSAELVALAISVLMVVGVAWIAPFFYAFRRSEERLRKSEESLAQAQRIAHLGNWSWDVVKNEVRWSEEVHRIFGTDPREFDATYEAFLGSVHPEEREFVRRSIEAALYEGKGYSIDHRIVLPDGSERVVHERGGVDYDSQGRPVRMVGTVQDITERKRAEEEIKQAHRKLQEAYEKLEKAQAAAVSSEKLAALGRLTAGVSHEILNPLNVITMTLQMLLDNAKTAPEVVEDCQDMLTQANRIAKIAQDLLYFARQRMPERRRFDLNVSVKRTLGLFEHELRLSNIRTELKLAEDLPPVYADEDQIQQVVFNLLGNARDAMPGGGYLGLRTLVEEAEGDRWATLRVEDTGPGIDPVHMPRIFDPFFTTKPEGEGTGLGLAICQGILETHEGSIWAENRPGGGAVFVVRLGVEQ